MPLVTQEMWIELAAAIVAGVVGGYLAGGIVNRWQGDDCRKSANGGLLSGIITAVVSWATIVSFGGLGT